MVIYDQEESNKHEVSYGISCQKAPKENGKEEAQEVT
jgi:hypothetical protein